MGAAPRVHRQPDRQARPSTRCAGCTSRSRTRSRSKATARTLSSRRDVPSEIGSPINLHPARHWPSSASPLRTPPMSELRARRRGVGQPVDRASDRHGASHGGEARRRERAPSSTARAFASPRARRQDARFLSDRLGLRPLMRRSWLAAANRLIPPNVFYFEKDGLAAKYAVLSEADFSRTNARLRRGPSRTAARFAQPSRLVWAAEAAATNAIIDAVSNAGLTSSTGHCR